MKQYEFSARNVQEAISKGLKELKVNQEDVDIKVLGEGGLFTRARILMITTEEEPEPVKVEPKPIKIKKEEPKKTVKKPEMKQEAPKKEIPEKQTEEVKSEPVETNQPIKEREVANLKDVTAENLGRKSICFIIELAKKLGAETETVIKEDGENLFVELNGTHAGMLIGYRGEGLSGIQYLANTVELMEEETKNRRRILLNIQNYKEKREESLVNLAKRMASKAIRTGRPQRLEPMNAYDRRIIHAALTDSDVTTYSKGEEPHRYLMIEPK